MENNNKGRGIFYGVIGVATLIVAIIGATFAYFSASITSNNITTNATTINLEITENTDGLNYQLIPVDEYTNATAFATQNKYIGAKTATTPVSENCMDDDGNEFCSVYEFTIKNPSETTAQEVYAQLDVYTNSFTTNPGYCYGTTKDTCSATVDACNTALDAAQENDATLATATCPAADAEPSCPYLEKTGEAMYCGKSNYAFAIFKGTADNVNDSTDGAGWAVTGNAVTTVKTATDTDTDADSAFGNTTGTTVIGELGDMVVARTAIPTYTGEAGQTRPVFTGGASGDLLYPLHQTLRPGGEVTYTVLMWLHENWEDQEADEGKSFAAGITFSTSLGGSGVTANLSGS